MDLTQYKITGYKTGIQSLPDYPSDGGYTAAELKAVFDARSDGEIMEQHNALVDALKTQFGQVEVDIADEVEMHNGISDAHSELFSPIHERITGILGDILSMQIAVDEKASSERMDTAETDINILYGEMSEKVDKVAGKGLSTNDFTDEWKQSISNAFDEAIYAQTDLDSHRGDRKNPHGVTAEQVGLGNVDNTRDAEKWVEYADESGWTPHAQVADEAETDSMGNVIHATYAKKEEVYTTVEADIAMSNQLQPLENDIGVLSEEVSSLKEQIGDIDAALDAILAIQNELIGGDEV